MNCAKCGQEIAKVRFPGAVPALQSVFTMHDGQAIHVPPCPEREALNPPATETGD